MTRLEDLKEIRRLLGKSQSEIAALLGVSTRAVQSYEQGWRPVPVYVQKLAGMLLYFARQREGRRLSPCWRVMQCDREHRAECFAYASHAEDFCWMVAGDTCEKGVGKTADERLESCKQCPAMVRWLSTEEAVAQ